MKIRAIKVYQAITFNKSNETSFTSVQIRNKLPVQFTLLKDIQAIELKNETDHVIVPLANVAAIYVWTDKRKEEEAQTVEDMKQKPGGLKATDIKRPR